MTKNKKHYDRPSVTVVKLQMQDGIIMGSVSNNGTLPGPEEPEEKVWE